MSSQVKNVTADAGPSGGHDPAVDVVVVVEMMFKQTNKQTSKQTNKQSKYEGHVLSRLL